MRTPRWRSRAALVALLGGLVGCGASPAPAPATPPGGASPGDAGDLAGPSGPFLWEVTGGDAAAPSYLFGTVHVGVSARELPNLVWERWRSSTTFVMEADLSEVNPFAMMQLAMLPADQSLRELLGPEHWDKLVAATKDLLPAAAVERLQPWMLTTLLTVDPGDTRMLDTELFAYSTEAGMDLQFLETAEEQFRMLANTADVDDLRSLLDDLDAGREGMRQLIDAYRSGDLAAVTRQVIDPAELAENPQALDALLFDRNRAWVPKLEPLLRRGGAFVAVGLGHFPGDAGLLQLLRARGYTVKRLGGGTPALVPDRDPPVAVTASTEQCEMLLRRMLATDPQLEGEDPAALQDLYAGMRDAWVADCTDDSARVVGCALAAPDPRAMDDCTGSR